MATYEDFTKVDIRVGEVIAVEDFPEVRKPLYKITVDFGSEIGVKKSAVGLGLSDENGTCILIRPDRAAPPGSRMF